jgi:tetratricopeptide (TPR) repeat protein
VVGYSLDDAARILKVKPSRLRYWDRTDLVQTRGHLRDRRGFDFRDLVCVKGILSLLEQGVSLQRIRRSVDDLREHVPDLEDPLGALRIWAQGSPRVVIDHDGILLEPDGQMVLDFRTDDPTTESVAPFASEDPPGSDPLNSATALALFEEGCRLDSDPQTFDEAIEVYRKGIEADPEFADIHCNLGAVHYNQGDREVARRCFERCLELSPGHVEAHFNLGNLLEENGCDDMALLHYRAAAESDPFCLDLQVNLALLHEKMGNGAKGKEHWRRYLQLDAEGAWADVARMRLEEA